MRARTCLSVFVPFALLATLIGCNNSPTPDGPGKDPSAGGSQANTALLADDPSADVGAPLFKPAGPPPVPPAAALGNEPIIIPNCTAQFEERQTISAEVDGKIDLIATPMTRRPDGVWEYRLPDGSVVTHDPKKFDPRNVHPRIDFNPRERVAPETRDHPEQWVPYFKLREGDVVENDQILCTLDDSQVSIRMKGAARIRAASEKAIASAKEGEDYTRRKIDLYKNNPGAIAEKEKLDDLTMLSRFTENLAQSESTLAKAQLDYDDANVLLGKHRVKSRVNGIIRNVAKRDGEFVKAGEKIFEVQSTQMVRLEGNLDVQYYDKVLQAKRQNLPVVVEPAIPSAPVKSHGWHRQEVAGVAVTGHAARPLVVSAGLDGSALVWDPNLGDAKDRPSHPHNLPHPVGVRSVACTPPGSPAVLAVTGGDDGKVRVWDLANPDKLPKEPAREPADAHAAGITAVAVSPDGKYAATAAGREVFVWDLAAGKKMYALPESHRDAITSLSFTPQCQLVTAAKDRTLKVWKVGAAKAAPVRTVDHRSGAVDTLGVSPDGGWSLFDQDKSRIDLVNLSDAQTVGQLSNVGPSAAFATLALFAPDHADPKTPVDKLPPYRILTAGGEGDLKGALQVWEAPRAGGRGSEIARLVTPGRTAVTCAAFSPHKDTPFLVVGTAAGTVHVWTPPTGPARRLEGRITNIDSTDPRYVTVRIEMNNKDVGLLDRSAATVIVHPGN
jgi:WD40 repeat protein